MAIETVAILSPGDMGHAVGRALGEHGLDVITCLQGRSERTKGLARQANIRDVPTLEEMVSQADLVLSILVQAEAIDVAHRVADAIRRTGAEIFYADCNAVSPRSVATMDAVIRDAGGRFIDGSIVGYPPGIEPRPRRRRDDGSGQRIRRYQTIRRCHWTRVQPQDVQRGLDEG